MVKRWNINHQSAIATLSPSLQKKMSTKRFARFLNFSLNQRCFHENNLTKRMRCATCWLYIWRKNVFFEIFVFNKSNYCSYEGKIRCHDDTFIVWWVKRGRQSMILPKRLLLFLSQEESEMGEGETNKVDFFSLLLFTKYPHFTIYRKYFYFFLSKKEKVKWRKGEN